MKDKDDSLFTEPTNREMIAFMIGFNYSHLANGKITHYDLIREEKFLCATLHFKYSDFRIWQDKLQAKAIKGNQSVIDFAMQLLNSRDNIIEP